MQIKQRDIFQNTYDSAKKGHLWDEEFVWLKNKTSEFYASSLEQVMPFQGCWTQINLRDLVPCSTKLMLQFW